MSGYERRRPLSTVDIICRQRQRRQAELEARGLSKVGTIGVPRRTIYGLGRPVELGIAEAMEALRAELARAAVAGADSDFQFPVDGAQLEFHVAVKKEGKGDVKVRFWVVEAGAGGTLSREEIHKVTVTLGAPVDADGRPVKITRSSQTKP